MIKVSKYQKHISKFSFEPKDKRKISALGFLKLGQKFFVRFLDQMKTLKFAFDIYWPLAISQNHIWDIYHGYDLKSSGKKPTE